MTACAGEPQSGPGWTLNPACAVVDASGAKQEVPCPPAIEIANPVQELGESVEAQLKDAAAKQKLQDATSELYGRAGVQDCDVQAVLNENLPYLDTK